MQADSLPTELRGKPQVTLKSFVIKSHALIKHESESEVAQSCWTLSTPWTVAYQAPQSMEFSRQEYWGGLPFPSPQDLPHPGIKPTSSVLAGGFFITWIRKWQPTPILLPGESHGRRSLVGYSPPVAKSRTRLSEFTFTFKNNSKAVCTNCTAPKALDRYETSPLLLSL